MNFTRGVIFDFFFFFFFHFVADTEFPMTNCYEIRTYGIIPHLLTLKNLVFVQLCSKILCS